MVYNVKAGKTYPDSAKLLYPSRSSAPPSYYMLEGKLPIKAFVSCSVLSFQSRSLTTSLLYLKKKSTLSKQYLVKMFATFFLMNALIFTSYIIAQVTDDENCETLQSEVHITKDEYDEIGRLKRTCSGDVSVTKCEGFCSSQVQPSVASTTGFSKECYCCRESYLKERHITLHHCYDADGIKLINEEDGIMEIKIREPAECRCIKCGDTSR